MGCSEKISNVIDAIMQYSDNIH